MFYLFLAEVIDFDLRAEFVLLSFDMRTVWVFVLIDTI